MKASTITLTSEFYQNCLKMLKDTSTGTHGKRTPKQMGAAIPWAVTMGTSTKSQTPTQAKCFLPIVNSGGAYGNHHHYFCGGVLGRGTLGVF